MGPLQVGEATLRSRCKYLKLILVYFNLIALLEIELLSLSCKKAEDLIWKMRDLCK